MCKGSSSQAETLSNYYKSNPKEFLSLLKEGPAPKYRWLAWRTALNIDQIYSKDVYGYLLKPESKSGSKYIPQIKAESKKTFDYYFAPEQIEFQNAMIAKLENVLIAISIYCPDIGYRSGINLIVSFLLMVSDLNDEDTFWAFIAIIKDKLIQDPLNICGASDIYIDFSAKANFLHKSFNSLFDTQLPDLKRQFVEAKVKDGQWIEKWFLDVFLSSFSFNYCLRFWDYILSYGFSGIFKLSLAVLMCTKEKFIGNDYMECSAIINSFSDGENLPTPEQILETADKIVIDTKIVEPLPKLMESGYGPKLMKRVTYEVNKETGLMAGIEDEPEIGSAKHMEIMESASRSKLN